jgi:voltage-gated potassium channel
MIAIALLVVPVIVFELFFEGLLQRRPGLKLAVDAASALIWACFVAEFVLVVAVVERPLRYCRQNWINLAVIVLPVIAFLRLLQLGRLLMLQQLVKTSRVFRLRGLLFRAWRAIVTLDVIDKILRRDPLVRLVRTKGLLDEKLEEIEVLRQEVAHLEKLVAEKARLREGDDDTSGADVATESTHSSTVDPSVGAMPDSVPSRRR